MSASDADYRHALTEIVKAQIVILGPDITFARLQKIPGIKYNSNGEVTAFMMDEQQAFQLLANEYIPLSPMVVKKSINTILQKYPDIHIDTTVQP